MPESAICFQVDAASDASGGKPVRCNLLILPTAAK